MWHVHACRSAKQLLQAPSHGGLNRATLIGLQLVWHQHGNPVLPPSCDRGAEADAGRGSFSFKVTRKVGAQVPVHRKDSAPSSFPSDSPKEPSRRFAQIRGKSPLLATPRAHPTGLLARCPELPSLQSYGRSAYGAATGGCRELPTCFSGRRCLRQASYQPASSLP